MLKPYRMLLVVQGSCSVLHNDALGSNRDTMRCYVSVVSSSIGSAIFDKVLVVFWGVGGCCHVSRCILPFQKPFEEC